MLTTYPLDLKNIAQVMACQQQLTLLWLHLQCIAIAAAESLTLCARPMMASSRTWRGFRLLATTPPRVVEGKTGKTIAFRRGDLKGSEPAFETIHHFVVQRTTVRQMRWRGLAGDSGRSLTEM